MFLKFEKNTFHVYIVCSHCLIFFPANFYRVLCTFQDIQQHIDVSSFLVWKQLYKASIFFFKVNRNRFFKVNTTSLPLSESLVSNNLQSCWDNEREANNAYLSKIKCPDPWQLFSCVLQ